MVFWFSASILFYDLLYLLFFVSLPLSVQCALCCITSFLAFFHCLSIFRRTSSRRDFNFLMLRYISRSVPTFPVGTGKKRHKNECRP